MTSDTSEVRVVQSAGALTRSTQPAVCARSSVLFSKLPVLAFFCLGDYRKNVKMACGVDGQTF